MESLVEPCEGDETLSVSSSEPDWDQSFDDREIIWKAVRPEPEVHTGLKSHKKVTSDLRALNNQF